MAHQELSRDLYVDHALPQVGQILQLLDRNPLSPTAGCFDRQYWHYRTLDFPCGMSQEFVYPIALAYATDIPGNPYFQQPRMREWAESGIRFAMKSGHADGSCDDYYPFERALGATVFSLYAMAEAYELLGIQDSEILEFLVRRARWAASHDESGVLTNHHAIAAAALHVTHRVSGESDLKEAATKKADEVLSHQHDEGWFLEYEGFDPGYQSVTIDYLARYWKASGNDAVLPALEKAVDLMSWVQHPDGTIGGEYGARNTYHALPHGFEILGERMPKAQGIADRLLLSLSLNRRARNDDDRLLAHHVYPYLLAWRDHRRIGTPSPPPEGRLYQVGSGLLVDRSKDRMLVTNLRKGGPFRCYRGLDLVMNDSGPTMVLEDGRTIVAHLGLEGSHKLEGDRAISNHDFHVASRERMTPFKMVVLRMLMLTIGRFFRTFVRKRLQKRLVTGKHAAPFQLERQFELAGDEIIITDRITRAAEAPRVKAAYLGVGQTSVTTAVAQPWEHGWLHPWTALPDAPEALNRTRTYSHKRTT